MCHYTYPRYEFSSFFQRLCQVLFYTITANMLTTYYSRGCNSKELFSNLKIVKTESFEKHLNKYNVIHINMVNFLNESQNMDEMIAEI